MNLVHPKKLIASIQGDKSEYQLTSSRSFIKVERNVSVSKECIHLQLHNSIIPSIRHLKDLDKALQSPGKYVLLSDVHIGNLEVLVKKCHKENRKVLVHLDLVDGLTKDAKGVKFLKEIFQVDGIISPNKRIATYAKKLGLKAFYRLFLLDSKSLENGLQSIQKCHYDGIEMLPGPFAIQVIDKVRDLVPNTPLLAGGFIEDEETVEQLFTAGFQGITTSKQELWTMKTK